MTFYVLGNGFDLHYGLMTTYYHFKEFLVNNGYGLLVRKVDNVFYEYGAFSPEEIANWSDFENMLVVFNRICADELYEEAMENAETDDDRAGFWDSPAWNVGYYNEYITILKKQFDIWIRTLNTKIRPDEFFCPRPKDYILSFNYTTTVEDNFSINKSAITHIHGTIAQNIVLGHNEYKEPDSLPVIEDEDSDYRDVTTRRAINEILEIAARQYFKNSEQIIWQNRYIFGSISNYDEVVIMGHSCGEQDGLYIQEIVRYAKKVVFYYHDLEAKANFESYLHGDIDVLFIKW